ncbi:Nse4 C-terminal-domain-containing protein [Mycena rebaudengoi]|nr:Nse4 C-terminal-domain-containing protein [Mycena rebaudengoi]
MQDAQNSPIDEVPQSSWNNASKGLVYDPDQDPQEKRLVRRGYRSLHKAIANNDSHQYNVEELRNGVVEANTLFDRVKNPQEATLDSSFLVRTAAINNQKARALKAGTGSFDVEDFIAKLVHFMGGNRAPFEVPSDDSDAEERDDDRPLEWARIGRRALAKSRRVPAMGFMLGPLSIEQKLRASNKQRAKFEKNEEDQTKPQELREEDIERAENETTKNVATVRTVMYEVGEINLFKLVINPQSFAQSVENIFYLSFLIRDAQAAFQINEEGEPLVLLCEEPTLEDIKLGVRKQQLIFEFDMETWRRAIEVFNITESCIPPRAPARTKMGDKWYG